MGAFLAAIPLLLTVTALSCLPSPSAGEDLAIQVCRNTTDFAFCRAAIYSDPHAPGADRYTLIDIVLRKAYLNATDTRGYIKSGGGGGELKKCLADYEKSVETLESMLNDVNSESYYELDIRSLDVERSARDCGKDLRPHSPLANRNQYMLKLANICYVVSKLFQYN